MTAEPIIAGPGEAVAVPPVTVEPVAPAPVAAPEPAAPAAAPEPVAPPTTSILSEPPAPAPVAESAPAAAASPTPEPVVEPTEPEPIVYQFTFPENTKPDDQLLEGAKELFQADRLAQPQAERYVAYFNEKVVPRMYQQFLDEQWRAATDRGKEWVQKFESDPEIGGNRRQTTVDTANAAIRDVFSNDERLKDWREMAAWTGSGNHPENIRAWSEVGRRFQQIYALTGTNSWADAMKKLSEPQASEREVALPPRAVNGSGSAADRRYGRN